MKNVNHKEIIEAIRHIINTEMMFVKSDGDYYEAHIFVDHIPQSMNAVNTAVVHEYDVIINYIHNVWDEDTYGSSEYYMEVIEEFVLDNVAISFHANEPGIDQIQGMLPVEPEPKVITTLAAIIEESEEDTRKALEMCRSRLDYEQERKYKELQHTFNLEHSETVARAEPFRFIDLLDKPINYLLDLYNDYTALYNVFKDEIYQSRIELIQTALATKEPK